MSEGQEPRSKLVGCFCWTWLRLGGAIPRPLTPVKWLLVKASDPPWGPVHNAAGVSSRHGGWFPPRARDPREGA